MGQTLYQVPKPLSGEIHHKIELLSRNSFVEQRFHIKFVDGKSEFLERSVEINRKEVDFKDLYKNIIQKWSGSNCAKQDSHLNFIGRDQVIRSPLVLF